jgi:hypothetical protein
MPDNRPGNPAEIEAELGTRGNVRIDSSNRHVARRWIAAKGWGAAFAAILSVRELGIAYNSPQRNGGEFGKDAWLMKRYNDFMNKAPGKAPQGDQGVPENLFDVNPAPGADAGEGDAQEGEAQAQGDQGGAGEGDAQDQGDQGEEKAKDNLAALFRQFHDERLALRFADQVGQRPDKADELAKALAKPQGAGELDPRVIQDLIDRRVKDALAKQGNYAPQRIEVMKDGELVGKVEGRTPPWFGRVLKLLMKGQNVMLVGPAGCGKSHNAAKLAEAMGVSFGMIHGSAGASESQLSGWLLPIGEGGKFVYVPSDFVRKYEQGKTLFCLDEIDAFDPNMLVMSNGATANGHFYVPHRYENPCVIRGENAMIIATANTFGTGGNIMYAGRNALDTTTLDRYIMIECDYDTALEKDIAQQGGLTEGEADQLWSIRAKVRSNMLRRVISTRAFQKAAALKAVGDDWPLIVNTLLSGWTPDERAKVGA